VQFTGRQGGAATSGGGRPAFVGLGTWLNDRDTRTTTFSCSVSEM
jgi:hypothetical protein